MISTSPVPFLDLKAADAELRSRVEAVISKLIASSSFIGGAEVQAFAQEFGAFCGGSCVPVANGTDALILALRALGIGAGDEVITVPFTFVATTEAITNVGATIKFVDINPKTYTLDPGQLEKAIGARTKAILPVHLFGQTADMDPILDIARKHKLNVIEDAAQAHGATYNGRQSGTLGDVACFSFYPTKNLGAFGDAGAVVSKSTELLAKVAQLGDHGRADKYLHAVEGINSRMDAFQAAVLRIKLRDLEAKNERRRMIAARYTAALTGQSFITPPYVAPYAKHVFHLYSVESSFRDQLMRSLQDRGIGCGVYYPIPLHLQPAYARLRVKRGDFPASEHASDRVLALPMFPEMTEEQIAIVCDAIRNFSPKR